MKLNKEYSFVSTTGKDKVYGFITSNIEIDISLKTLYELYGYNVSDFFAYYLVGQMWNIPNRENLHFKAIFWSSGNETIVGFII